MPSETSAHRVALALLDASGTRDLGASALVGAGALLGLSANSMRVALSRLVASGAAIAVSRGRYALAPARRAAIAHVRASATGGFAPRVPWQGGYVGVLTADLSRRHATAVRRRERALGLVGLRPLRHGLYARPDNLEGGVARVASQLAVLGLDPAADVVGLGLDEATARQLLAAYDVARDAAQVSALEAKVRRLLDGLDRASRRRAASATLLLGDEVLRTLARDPLLPEALADPRPRRALAEAMAALDVRGRRLWFAVLDEFESRADR